MKKQILMLVIGILIGAIITTGVFFLLKGGNNKQMDRMDRGEPPMSMDGNSIDGGERMRGRPDEENSVKPEITEDSNESNS